MNTEIIIVGAGAAGIGMGIVFKKMGLDFLILEQGVIGESFQSWSPGTNFISPSFTGNYFGSPDLNAVCPDSSPAYMLNTEHPSGKQYAKYLKELAHFYDLPIREKTKVVSLKKEKNTFEVKTNTRDFSSSFVIWAGGEFQFPRTDVCEGFHYGIHNTHIKDWGNFSGAEIPIIGGYESAYDSAFQLARIGKKSIIFDSKNHFLVEKSDSSFSLSPFTKDRFKYFYNYITIKPFSRITKITKEKDLYHLLSEKGETFSFNSQPILATGFKTSLTHVKDFFTWKDGSPELSKDDESTKKEGFYLIGPQVKHQNVIFCFIYKFRQRFPIVAAAIAQKIGLLETENIQKVLSEYRKKNFYLEDLSCCSNECVC